MYSTLSTLLCREEVSEKQQKRKEEESERPKNIVNNI